MTGWWTLFYVPYDVNHLHSGLGGLRALVTFFITGTIHGLYRIINGQNTKDHRYILIKGNLRDTMRTFLRYKFKMRCFTTDDGAQCDYRLTFSFQYQALYGNRNFECTGHVHNNDIFFSDPGLHKRCNTCSQQTVHNMTVKAARDDADHDLFGLSLSFNKLIPCHINVMLLFPLN